MTRLLAFFTKAYQEDQLVLIKVKVFLIILAFMSLLTLYQIINSINYHGFTLVFYLYSISLLAMLSAGLFVAFGRYIIGVWIMIFTIGAGLLSYLILDPDVQRIDITVAVLYFSLVIFISGIMFKTRISVILTLLIFGILFTIAWLKVPGNDIRYRDGELTIVDLSTAISSALEALGIFVLISIVSMMFSRYIGQLLNELRFLNANLEDKVKERTQQLNETNKELSDSLSKITKLKVQQDGDYFLTSLLVNPLITNQANNTTVDVEFFISQKTKFHFKKKKSELGGDLCIAHSIKLHGKDYTAFINGDAMGKSLQGAGGAIVLGVLYNSFITRSKETESIRNMYPEKWLWNCYRELQSVFTAFDGSMLISLIAGLVDEETGHLYYFNSEHPFPILYCMGQAKFLETNIHFHKIGLEIEEDEFKINTCQLNSGDVLIIGSDGKDDLVLRDQDKEGNRIINEDETLFLRIVEQGEANLQAISQIIESSYELTDDCTLLKITFNKYPLLEEDIIEGQSQFYSFKTDGLKASADGDYQKATDLLIQALDIKKDMDCYNVLIHSLFKQHDYKTAAQYLEEALYHFPMHLDFCIKATHAYKKIGEIETATHYGERYRFYYPGDIKILILLTDLYRMQKNYKQARSLLNELLEIEKEDHEAIHFLKNALDKVE